MKREIKKYDEILSELQEEKAVFEKKLQIRNLKRSMRYFKKPTTTKIIITYILVNCTVIEIYSMVAMWILNDLSALYSLIAAVVSESISFSVYAAKSYNETKQEELIKLERDKMGIWTNSEEDNPEA